MEGRGGEGRGGGGAGGGGGGGAGGGGGGVNKRKSTCTLCVEFKRYTCYVVAAGIYLVV